MASFRHFAPAPSQPASAGMKFVSYGDKVYANRIDATTWEKYKPILTDLNAQGLTRLAMREQLARDFGFRPSAAQLHAQMESWRLKPASKSKSGIASPSSSMASGTDHDREDDHSANPSQAVPSSNGGDSVIASPQQMPSPESPTPPAAQRSTDRQYSPAIQAESSQTVISFSTVASLADSATPSPQATPSLHASPKSVLPGDEQSQFATPSVNSTTDSIVVSSTKNFSHLRKVYHKTAGDYNWVSFHQPQNPPSPIEMILAAVHCSRTAETASDRKFTQKALNHALPNVSGQIAKDGRAFFAVRCLSDGRGADSSQWRHAVLDEYNKEAAKDRLKLWRLNEAVQEPYWHYFRSMIEATFPGPQIQPSSSSLTIIVEWVISHLQTHRLPDGVLSLVPEHPHFQPLLTQFITTAWLRSKPSHTIAPILRDLDLTLALNLADLFYRWAVQTISEIILWIVHYPMLDERVTDRNVQPTQDGILVRLDPLLTLSPERRLAGIIRINQWITTRVADNRPQRLLEPEHSTKSHVINFGQAVLTDITLEELSEVRLRLAGPENKKKSTSSLVKCHTSNVGSSHNPPPPSASMMDMSQYNGDTAHPVQDDNASDKMSISANSVTDTKTISTSSMQSTSTKSFIRLARRVQSIVNRNSSSANSNHSGAMSISSSDRDSWRFSTVTGLGSPSMMSIDQSSNMTESR